MKKERISLKETLKGFSPLKRYFIQNRWPLVIGLFSLLFVDFLQLMIPMVIKRAIDALTLKTADSQLLFQYGLTIFCIAVIIAVFRYLWRYFLFGHSRKVEEGLRNQLFDHLQKLSMSFYQRTKTGDLMARSINDIQAIRMATGMGMVALTDGLVLGMAAIGFMIYINIKLTLIALIPVPVIIYLTRVLTRRMSAEYERVQATFSDLTERAREAFSAIRVVKAYCREPWQGRRVEEKGRHYINENMQLAKTMAIFLPMMAVLTNLGMAILIWLGGRLTILGQITTGDFVAFIGYLNLLTWPMMAMGWVTNLIQRGSASMRRINRILNEVPEIQAPEKNPRPHGIQGEIEILGLTMTYPNHTEPALKDVSLRIEAGQTIALVGRVGSGKTTLLNAIPRLLESPEGAVSIDGLDIHHFPLKELRKSIGFVTQETVIFSDTIRNNVVFGREGPIDSALEEALRAAHIYDEMNALDDKLESLLGERGITLSGGQRQRLTIARALLDDPPILILDDGLSMVDTRTEEKILNRLLSVRKDKTNLIVSHRLSTISRADFIYVFKNGCLVEMGDHRSLMEKGEEYPRIYRRQLLAQELEIGVV
jgi:ATP-binding cassette subfamily B protein